MVASRAERKWIKVHVSGMSGVPAIRAFTSVNIGRAVHIWAIDGMSARIAKIGTRSR
ncbi:MAG TPA: hypothetical protein VHU80_16830 [Polyangiaceae bacterium]|jgi:hypothetical protein|nr:hypothetical protein [Polyangiaceae bacterium]